jgi:hypothetical protein
MTTRYSRFVLPVSFFGLAVLAWVGLGKIAVSDIGASIGNDLRRVFDEPEITTHPVLGWTLLCVAVLSFLFGLFFTWRLSRSLKYERRA